MNATQPGPPLEILLRHLSECPAFALDMSQKKDGEQLIIAWICDLFRTRKSIDRSLEIESFAQNQKKAKGKEAHLGVVAAATWVLYHPWFRQLEDTESTLATWLLGEQLERLSRLCSPESWTNDPDRREELVRLCLKQIGFHPANETIEQAADRMNLLDSEERVKVLRSTAAAERRAREIREAMARDKAKESASRYGE